MKKKIVKKNRKVKPHISAWLDDGKGGRLMVTVPVRMGTIPEAPTVVLFENHAYVSPVLSSDREYLS